MDRKLTDGPELVAYIVAHAIGMALGFLVAPQLYMALVAAGHEQFIQPVSMILSLAVSAAVLLGFLLIRQVLRKGAV